MREVGAALLAVEAGRTLLLDAPALFAAARAAGIPVFGATGGAMYDARTLAKRPSVPEAAG